MVRPEDGLDDSDMLTASHRKDVSRYAAEYDKEAEERDARHKEIFGNDIFDDKSLSPLNQRLDVSPEKLFSPSRNNGNVGGGRVSSNGVRLDSIKTRLRLDRTSGQVRPNPPFASFQEECLHLREETALLKRRNAQLSNLLRRFVAS